VKTQNNNARIEPERTAAGAVLRRRMDKQIQQTMYINCRAHQMEPVVATLEQRLAAAAMCPVPFASAEQCSASEHGLLRAKQLVNGRKRTSKWVCRVNAAWWSALAWSSAARA
jgi:hypothetical protein